MLYKEIMAIGERHTGNINTMCGKKYRVFCVKLAVRVVTIGLLSVTILCNIFASSCIVPLISKV